LDEPAAEESGPEIGDVSHERNVGGLARDHLDVLCRTLLGVLANRTVGREADAWSFDNSAPRDSAFPR
jgi:hypothetical protein